MQKLRGTTRQNGRLVKWTALAAPYPLKLCQELAAAAEHLKQYAAKVRQPDKQEAPTNVSMAVKPENAYSPNVTLLNDVIAAPEERMIG